MKFLTFLAISLGLTGCIEALDRIDRQPSAETMRLWQMCVDQGNRPELVDGNRNVVCHRPDPWPSASEGCAGHGGPDEAVPIDGGNGHVVMLITCRDGKAVIAE